MDEVYLKGFFFEIASVENLVSKTWIFMNFPSLDAIEFDSTISVY